MVPQLRKLGDTLPPFSNLRGVDGKFHAYTDFSADILIIVFSCNHCPYVQAYEDRMIRLQQDYEKKGVQLVALNSNDAKSYPDDSFELMVKRARDRGFNFPYLRDEDQSVADAFGATHTPQFFVFDKARKLCYSGKMDDNWKEPEGVKEAYLKVALDSLIAGEKVKVPETYSIGCTIKRKSQ